MLCFTTQMSHTVLTVFIASWLHSRGITLNELIIREEKLFDDYSGRNECAREECLMYSLQHVMLDGSKSTGLRPSPARF